MTADLNDLHAFARVAATQSFRKAAQELQVTPSALSHAMRKLETEIGIRLLNRTTRSVSPTVAGEQLLRQLTPAFLAISDALDKMNDLRLRPSGKLRLNVPRPAAQLPIAPQLAQWRHSYPDIQLEVVSNDTLVDIVADGYDAGIRFGASLQQDMVAIPVGAPVQFVVCAAPAYFAAHGKPVSPADLLQHECLQLRFNSGACYRWEFEKAADKLDVETHGAIASDDLQLLLQSAIDGAGICYTYAGFAAQHVASGQLEYALSDWWPEPEHFFLYYPSGRNMSASLRALVDFFKFRRPENELRAIAT